MRTKAKHLYNTYKELSAFLKKSTTTKAITIEATSKELITIHATSSGLYYRRQIPVVGNTQKFRVFTVFKDLTEFFNTAADVELHVTKDYIYFDLAGNTITFPTCEFADETPGTEFVVESSVEVSGALFRSIAKRAKMFPQVAALTSTTPNYSIIHGVFCYVSPLLIAYKGTQYKDLNLSLKQSVLDLTAIIAEDCDTLEVQTSTVGEKRIKTGNVSVRIPKTANLLTLKGIVKDVTKPAFSVSGEFLQAVLKTINRVFKDIKSVNLTTDNNVLKVTATDLEGGNLCYKIPLTTAVINNMDIEVSIKLLLSVLGLSTDVLEFEYVNEFEVAITAEGWTIRTAVI